MSHQHFILHKPTGYLSQLINNQDRRKNKKLLTELYAFPKGAMAIGRLDEKSEGLLLLTTDGKVSEFIRSNKIEKEYYAEVGGIVTNSIAQQLSDGVEISIEGKSYQTKPCTVRVLSQQTQLPFEYKKMRHEGHGPSSWLSLTLREGKYRQVRKMTSVLGFPCLRLVRVRIGKMLLTKEFRPGSVKEVEAFLT
ncbi:MAG: pseudouridine synthase [Flavobacteriales bacterium]|nr:pseudouridine synthase [Flavobacteriales bacterium]